MFIHTLKLHYSVIPIYKQQMQCKRVVIIPSFPHFPSPSASLTKRRSLLKKSYLKFITFTQIQFFPIAFNFYSLAAIRLHVCTRLHFFLIKVNLSITYCWAIVNLLFTEFAILLINFVQFTFPVLFSFDRAKEREQRG